MVISEMSVNYAATGSCARPAPASHHFGCDHHRRHGGLILLLLVLSSAILPSFNLLILVLVIVAVSGFLLYRGSAKLYAGAQFALRDTFAQEAGPCSAGHEPHGIAPPRPKAFLPAQAMRS